MIDLYKSIKAPSEGSFKARGSKFIAHAFPLQSETSIKSCLSDLRKQYHDARHHCYAWRLGPDLERYRINDDGEPSGSAGLPILGQIQSRDLTDILLVVVRYFGGTLLGVSGLIRAYRSAASDALDHADIIRLKVRKRFRVDFSYEQMNDVMRVIKEVQPEVEEQQFDLACSITLNVWVRMEQRLLEKLERIDGCTVDSGPSP